ncbi:MAG: type IV pilus assembly protein PilM [bacterium]|nr:type IV pilus assembly protein PilM [bacterium]
MFGIRGKVGVGIDLSFDRVKVCKMAKKKDKYFLLSLGEKKISPEPLRDDEKEAWTGHAIEGIKKLLSEHKIKEREVYASVSSNSVVIRYLKLPFMPASELREVIRFEAEDHIPFEVEQALIDFHITKEFVDKEERMMEVLLVAAKREAVNSYLDIFQKAGLEPVYINVDTFATEDAWSIGEEGGVEKEGVIALVDIGARTTNINIIETNASSFNRDIMVGGNDFTDAIKEEFGLAFSEAEKTKEERGGLLLGEEYTTITTTESGRVSYAIESVATRLLDELDRSFTYYYTQLPSYKKNIDRVILSGGSANLSNLTTFFSNGLGIDVMVARPLQMIDLSKSVGLSADLEKKGCAFATTIGLALRGLLTS